MKSQELLQHLQGIRKPMFTLHDIAKITGKKKDYLKVYLFRLKKRNILKEVERGKYTLDAHPFAVASNILFPSYISFLTSYAYYQITTQIPTTIQIVTPISKKRITYERNNIQFITLPKQRIFGYKREMLNGGVVFIAEKEKAIVDSLYLPEYCPVSETAIALQDKELDINKLIRYARRMHSIVVLKRLGYLLEMNGIDIFKNVKNTLNSRYDLLNPMIKKAGKKNMKWKLIINEVF